MKTVTKIVIGLVLSLLLTVTGVGYAGLTGHLNVASQMTMEPPQTILITSVTRTSSSVDTESVEIMHPSSLKHTVRGARNDTVTYEVKLWNNTPYEYAFAGLAYETSLDGYEGNDYIGVRNGLTITLEDAEGGTLNTSDVLSAYETETVYITYQIGRNVANTTLNTLVNFQFGVNVDSVSRVVIDKTFVKFGEILNDTTAGGGYETLVEKIDDKYNGADWSANFIGNVAGAEGIGEAGKADTATVNNLFGGSLKITIDGEETNVTVLIKREDVDGNTQTGDDYTVTDGTNTASGTGCEMTLYLTTDELDRSGANATVYAVVFTCDKNEDGTLGNWYQIGERYEGTATVVGYVGNTATQNTGSFDTGTWRSTYKTYQPVGAYSYTVRGSRTIQTITQATDQNAVNALQSKLTNAADVLAGDYGVFGGEAVTVLQEAFDRAARCYTVSGDTVTVKSDATRSQIIPLLQELEAALTPFESIIAGGKV